MQCSDWKIAGSRGEIIHGTTHTPEGDSRGIVLIAHGFLGYKDYGMFPWLAEQFSKIGWIAHRFNFSHSGMLEGKEEFVRTDLFEQATWNTQVEDLAILVEAFKQEGIPVAVLGHSRGGLASLLALGRGRLPVDGVVSLSAPSDCNPLTAEMEAQLLKDGFVERESSRTNQTLRIGKVFLQEQLDDPKGHNLLQLIASNPAKVLVVHGEDDPTVSVACAEEIVAQLQNPTIVRVEAGDHVFNTPNPFPIDGSPSPQLQNVWCAIDAFLPSL
jgi:uncharacterized protein